MSVHSHEALYVCDESMTVVEWNEAAEALTGIPAAEALGQKCWHVLRGRAESGEVVCHPGCSTGRHAHSTRPTGCGCLLVATPAGRKAVHISTIVVRDAGRLRVIHPMHNGVEIEECPPVAEQPPLTPRQREVLEMLAHGMRARAIAAELNLAEATVRNHIRAVRHELGTHSQLEAVAAARRAGILS